MKTLIQHLTLTFFATISIGLLQVYPQHSEFYGYGQNNIFKTDSNGNYLQVVYDFPTSFEGANPSSSLCKASNGKFYGFTQEGGVNDIGVIFEWDPGTNIYSKKLDLDSFESGYGQFCSLMQATNGKFYGMTSMGGENNCGVLFEWDPAMCAITKKMDFNGAENGSTPMGPLIQANNGKLYGITLYGGIDNCGVFFEWDLQTDTYKKEFDFSGMEFGRYPTGNLCMGDNNKLYGLSSEGGLNNLGVLFEWDPINNTYFKVLDFNSEFGRPNGTLIKASNGKFYGCTNCIFEWDPGTNLLAKRIAFNGHDECWPGTPESLVEADNGRIFGILRRGIDCILCPTLFEWDIMEDTIRGLLCLRTDPVGVLSSTGNGKLYGVTRMGGDRGYGMIYEWDTEKNILTQKIEFNKADQGLNPVGIPVKADNGKLYGVTKLGGDFNEGVLFEWDPSIYKYTKKYAFSGTGLGGKPSGSLLKAGNGKLYGMTDAGGRYNCGVLYEWDPSDNIFAKKLDFVNGSGGDRLNADLILATNGKLYGTHSEGGVYGNGVLFEWDPIKDHYRGILDFNGNESGSNPQFSPVQANNGKLYGTTDAGGSNNSGVLYEYDPGTHTFEKKLDFTGAENGSHPTGNLLKADNGKLYGITHVGGSNDLGVLYEYDPDHHTFEKKIDFTGVENGSQPIGTLLKADDGKLYGITYEGGTNGSGVLFEWDPDNDVFAKRIDFKKDVHAGGPLMQAKNRKIYGICSHNSWNSIFVWDPVTGILDIKSDSLVGEMSGLSEIIYPKTETRQVEACESYVSPSGKYTWYTSGVYTDTLPGPAGYFTILTINLTIRHSSENMIHASAIYRYISPGGKIWKNSGTYKDTIPNATGCDSIITIQLTIVPSDTTSAQEFYGLTYSGGAYNNGTIYKTDIEGNNLTVVYSFNSDIEGSHPIGSLVQVNNEKLYGTTYSGGQNDYGVLFEWDVSTNTFTKKADFTGAETGIHPGHSMVLADNGKLIGETNISRDGSPTIFEWDLSTNVLTKRYNFPTGNIEIMPMGSLVKAKNGKIYGSAYENIKKSGEIFEWNPVNNAFIIKNEDVYSQFALTQADNGKFYGVCGMNTSDLDQTKIFEWVPSSNKYSIKCDFIPGVHNFTFPCSALTQADNGKFYGRKGDAENGYGYIYEWDTTFNIAAQRLGSADLHGNIEEDMPLLKASNGKLYGTSSGGGKYFKGTLFEYDPVTNNFVTKNYFNTTNGSNPSGGLIELKHYTRSGVIHAEAFCSYTSPSGKYTWTNSGLYRDTIPNGSGGDSTINVYLTVNKTATTSINPVACNSYTSPSGKYVWTSSGVYGDTLSSIYGCDSVIMVNLAILPPVDVSVLQHEDKLTANAAEATYEWIDCDDGNNPVTGQIQQTFTAGKDGNYAVIVTQNGCVDTSACIHVSLTGLITNTFKSQIEIYPNPNKGSFFIDLGRVYSHVVVEITEMDSRLIKKESYNNQQVIDFKLDSSSGLYMVILSSGNERAVFKIMINQ